MSAAVPEGDALIAIESVHAELNDLLWEVSTVVGAMGEAALADTSLTLASSGMLASIKAAPGVTVAEMARRIPKTQQTISHVAARLVKLGYVERRLGTGRGIGLYLTPAGEEAAAEAADRERAHVEDLRELLGSERYERLSELLAQTRDILRPRERR